MRDMLRESVHQYSKDDYIFYTIVKSYFHRDVFGMSFVRVVRLHTQLVFLSSVLEMRLG